MSPETQPQPERLAFELNKLVRDGIYASMLNLDQRPVLDVIKPDETALEQLFKLKLEEESRELSQANTESEHIKEAADILEVWESYQRHQKNAGRQPSLKLAGFISQLSVKVIRLGLNVDDIYLKQTELARLHGSFDQLRMVKSIHLRADDQWLDYYQSRPEQFPRLN